MNKRNIILVAMLTILLGVVGGVVTTSTKAEDTVNTTQYRTVYTGVKLQFGDTLSEIAETVVKNYAETGSTYSVDEYVDAICKTNQIQNPDKISDSDYIIIPIVISNDNNWDDKDSEELKTLLNRK